MSIEAPLGDRDYKRMAGEANERAETAGETAEALWMGGRLLKNIAKQSQWGNIVITIAELQFLTGTRSQGDAEDRLQESAEAIEDAARHQEGLERTARQSATFDLSRLGDDTATQDSVA